MQANPNNNLPNLSVLISGGGSNLAALIEAIEAQTLNAQIQQVIADRDCQGKRHAFDANIPFVMIDRKLPAATFCEQLITTIPTHTQLIVLAGFLSVIPAPLIQAHPQKIINLHPSLLPKYGGMGMYGMRVHEAVLAGKDTQSGCTIHYVDEGIDSGDIIAQARVPVLTDDTPQSLQQRVQAQEHALLIRTVKELLTHASI